ncbi:MAG: arsenate reductase (glutaredoxin) [Bacteroidia bacterium]|nr:arsenate reductase (glutaredoxin) [Bacteroidia bacterium]MCO5254758.1 arsenate reductase (glutaredoxin) [Bacteroidota bacterium]MCZ2129033.1 arsenate reductase (glutaredoxin) [Bacteroidia bacterium]
MKYVIYHNPRCSKSRESLCYLQEQGAEIEVKEYMKDAPSAQELATLLKLLKIPAIDLIRKNENVFKTKFADKNYTDEQWIKVMAENPILIERPIVIKGKQAVIGRPIQKVIDLG